MTSSLDGGGAKDVDVDSGESVNSGESVDSGESVQEYNIWSITITF